ncbi:MAG: hypothetical protein IT233_12005 [Bacteroidia bacterium]|nr:hypothetical protein [Bacteroidia bacterium]
MEKEENKGYRIVETSSYNSLFFTGGKQKKEGFTGVHRKNLVDLLTHPSHKENKELLLKELRCAAGVALLIEAIHDHRGDPRLAALVAACWECGEDMSEHLQLFITLATAEPLPVALEALSVIEEIQKIPPGFTLPESSQTTEHERQNESPERQFILGEISKHLHEISSHSG